MIHQWELLHTPVDRDTGRYRLSLWADAETVENVRRMFPGRSGGVWVPRRKPYSAAFFLYKIAAEEKIDLEEILSGRKGFPTFDDRSIPVDDKGVPLNPNETQEVHIIDQESVAGDDASVGAGGASNNPRALKIGYLVSETMAHAQKKFRKY